MSYEIIEKLKKEIGNYKDEPKWEEIGQVIEVGDGIVKILGLRNVLAQELLIIETDKGERRAVALNLEEDSVGAPCCNRSGGSFFCALVGWNPSHRLRHLPSPVKSHSFQGGSP